MLARLLWIVLLTLLPGVSWAQPSPIGTSPIEVGAGITACMQDATGGAFVLHGTAGAAVLSESGWEFLLVARQEALNPGEYNPWPEDPIRPPIMFRLPEADAESEARGINDAAVRELRRYALNCFSRVYINR